MELQEKTKSKVLEKCPSIPTTANAIPAKQQKVSPTKTDAG